MLYKVCLSCGRSADVSGICFLCKSNSYKKQSPERIDYVGGILNQNLSELTEKEDIERKKRMKMLGLNAASLHDIISGK